MCPAVELIGARRNHEHRAPGRHNHLAGIRRAVYARAKPLEIAAQKDEIGRAALTGEHLSRQANLGAPRGTYCLHACMRAEPLLRRRQL